MNRNYLDEWAANVIGRTYFCLDETVRVEGLCKRHLGGRLEFARLSVVAEPAESFSVLLTLDDSYLEFLQKDRWMDAAIFGLLDILMTAQHHPKHGMKIVVVDAEYNDTDTSWSAFRFAGRTAGESILNSASRWRLPAAYSPK